MSETKPFDLTKLGRSLLDEGNRDAENDLTRALQDAFRGCRLCGFIGTRSESIAMVVNTIARNGAEQTLVTCNRCAFVQQLPMPTASELMAYYASGDYRREFPPLPVDGVPPDAGDAYEQACHNEAIAGARYLAGLGIANDARLLEIGCGEGRLAAVLARQLDVQAIELDPAMRAKATDRGVRCISHVSDPHTFDLVYALQVLEHQPDPLAALKEWRDYLCVGGRVHVQVPTIERMYGGARHFFQKPHVVNFTTRTLTAMLIMAGFEKVQVGIGGAVLSATATRSENPNVAGFPTYDEIEPAVTAALGPPDDVLDMIENHEAAIAARLAQIAADRGPLTRYLDGEDVPHEELVPEIVRMAETIDLLRETLGKLSNDLDAEAKRCGEQYHTEPFLRGYLMGKSRQSAVVGSAIAAISNSLVVRMLDRSPKEST